MNSPGVVMGFKPFLAACLVARCMLCLAADDPQGIDRGALDRVRDAALKSDWSYERLTDLTDRIGGRLPGSPQAEAAVQQVADAMRREGLLVRLEPVMVPHWVRGAERAELIDFPGHLPGIDQKIILTTLGGSEATAADGINGPLVVVRSLDELRSRGDKVAGKIVLINLAFDRRLADNGFAGVAYVMAGRARFSGPALAAQLGASAVLVRSVGGASYRLPHTGSTVWGDDGKRIPAAAVSAEDADLIARLAQKGTVTMHLTLTPQTLPDAPSSNVLAEIPGSDLKDEVVVVSAHLDSWDLGQGAIDNASGVAAAMGALQVIQSLHIKPRRTIRFIAWMGEENGERGALAYRDDHLGEFPKHAAVIETGLGGGRPLGYTARVVPSSLRDLAPVVASLSEIGAGVIVRRDDPVGSDITEIQNEGVPGFELLVDARNYFDYQHSAADTLDKVDPDNLRHQVAALAVLTYYLANATRALDRAPIVH
jgi:Zn-dependent M28 family amino/carboxypeptidase